MIVVLERGASPEQVEEVASKLRARGLEVRALRAGGKPVLHVTAGPGRRARKVLRDDPVEGLVAMDGPRIRREGHRLFPYHVLHWSAWWMVVLGAIVVLAGQLPTGVGRPIDLQNPPSETHVQWFARAPMAFLSLFPHSLAWLAWTLMLGVGLLFLALPRLDRSRDGSLASRAPVLGAVALFVLALVGFALKELP
jgi:quinol-cytochrome oxidoreductase complex cytochrome b subunit